MSSKQQMTFVPYLDFLLNSLSLHSSLSTQSSQRGWFPSPLLPSTIGAPRTATQVSMNGAHFDVWCSSSWSSFFACTARSVKGVSFQNYSHIHHFINEVQFGFCPASGILSNPKRGHRVILIGKKNLASEAACIQEHSIMRVFSATETCAPSSQEADPLRSSFEFEMT